MKILQKDSFGMFIDFWELKGAKKKKHFKFRELKIELRTSIYTISLPKFYMLIDPGCLA